MSEASAEALYQRAIIDLARKAETMPLLAAPAVRVTVDNPLCGDRVILDLTLDQEGRVQEVGNRTRGCLLCQAASAAIGRNALGQDAASLEAAFGRLNEALQNGFDDAAETLWPDLLVFAPVHRHKSRRDCVLLPFKALTQALGKAAG
jgi:nitrogen fixation NifU-like protein